MVVLPVERVEIVRNLYRDSLQLMKISESIKQIPGVIEVFIAMATEPNLRVLRDLGFAGTDDLSSISSSDLVVAVRASSEESLRSAFSRAMEMINNPESIYAEGGMEVFPDLDQAVAVLKDIDLAVISLPGNQVRDVALKLIDMGVNLFIFSDNVPVEHEVEIKRRALERDLLVMGPGAGTSIVSGVYLGFSNRVPRGPVGIAAAAGTGLQELSCILSQAGIGVSHGIGVGGNDVKDSVSGLMMIKALDLLDMDDSTEVISIVSKPPDRATLEKIIDHASRSLSKRVVAGFIGWDPGLSPRSSGGDRVVFGRTIHQTALAVARELGGDAYRSLSSTIDVGFSSIARDVERIRSRLAEPKRRRSLRGLYVGGTLAYEAQVVASRFIDELYSNAPLPGVGFLEDPFRSIASSIIDLGAEEFTRGRVHPMIDPSIRCLRLLKEASDPSVGVVLMDFVLGYGAHNDPAGYHARYIAQAREIAERDGRDLVFIARVVGVSGDPQNLDLQVDKLRGMGVYIYPSNAIASLVASLAVSDMDLDRAEHHYRDLVSLGG